MRHLITFSVVFTNKNGMDRFEAKSKFNFLSSWKSYQIFSLSNFISIYNKICWSISIRNLTIKCWFWFCIFDNCRIQRLGEPQIIHNILIIMLYFLGRKGLSNFFFVNPLRFRYKDDKKSIQNVMLILFTAPLKYYTPNSPKTFYMRLNRLYFLQ